MLKNLWEYSTQEVADKIALHLLKQGRVSALKVEGEDICVYRHPNGLKCAIGVLINDKDYDPNMEGKSFQSVLETYFPKARYITYPVVLNMLSEFQRLHDTENPRLWRQKILKLYVKFNINIENLQ